jgi:hypothetical protein
MRLIGHPTNTISEAVIGAAIEVHRWVRVDKLLPLHSAQLMTYMRLQRLSAGLLSTSTFTPFYTASGESCADPAVRAGSVSSVSPW